MFGSRDTISREDFDAVVQRFMRRLDHIEFQRTNALAQRMDVYGQSVNSIRERIRELELRDAGKGRAPQPATGHRGPGAAAPDVVSLSPAPTNAQEDPEVLAIPDGPSPAQALRPLHASSSPPVTGPL